MYIDITVLGHPHGRLSSSVGRALKCEIKDCGFKGSNYT